MAGKNKGTTVDAKAPVSTSDAKDLSVITCDMEGRIETFNAAASRIFGYAPDEVVGRKRVSLFSPGEIVLGHVPTWLKTASKQGAYEGDTVFVRKDGSRFAAHIRITPTYGHDEAGNKVQIGYCGQTRVLAADPAKAMPPTSLATRIFKGVVIARLPFLTATLVPILIAAAWIAQQGLAEPFPWAHFALVLTGGLALHVAANTFNDHYDWKQGTDQANNDYFLPFSGGSRAVELGLISNKGMFNVGVAALTVAALCGAALAFLDRPWVLAFGAVGAITGWAYTAPPLRLSARGGLGEFSSFLNFGPLMTAGAVYGISGHLGLDALLLGLPIGLMTLAILWVNEFPDAASDLATGKRQLVARLGTGRARWAYPGIQFAAFAAAAVLVATGITGQGALLLLLTLPLAAWAAWSVVRNHDQRRLAKACAATIALHATAGLLMAAGLAWL